MPSRGCFFVGRPMLEIWHNPRCSKSRQTLEIIEASGIDVRVRRYLDEPPTPRELDDALAALGMEPRDLARLGETIAADLGLEGSGLTRAEWLGVMARNPILIERPVVLHDDGRAIIGRPPENVKKLL